MVAMGFMVDNHTLALGLCPHARVVINHKSLATMVKNFLVTAVNL